MRWRLFYQDTFDRDSYPSLEVEGCGLVPGLMELWVRYLGEELGGFSAFNLALETTGVRIQGPRSTMERLKHWVLEGRLLDNGHLKAADLEFTRQLALGHARLVDQGLGLESLLAGAESTPDKTEFLGWLESRWQPEAG